MIENIIEVHQLNRVFQQGKSRRTHVLKDINVNIKRGEFVALMGPSGSGKTTFLYNISGMDQMTSGSVILNGKKIEEQSEESLANLRLTQMGFVFQDINLLRNLNLLDNIIYAGYIAKKRKKIEVTNDATQLMRKMGIDKIKHQETTEASGGQLQRVGICRALINEPEIIFGDEPTGSLNSKATDEILTILLDINREGTTVVLVTHDVRVASHSERVLFIMDGQIKDEKSLGKFDKSIKNSHIQLEKRERNVSMWLKENEF